MLANIGLDRYERKARFQPLLTAALPLIGLIAVWLPEIDTPKGYGFAALLTGAVVTLMMGWIRQRGHNVQENLKTALGGAATTIMIRHGGLRLSPLTRSRVHKLLQDNGFELPTEIDQANNPGPSDQVYEACVAWLRERTRSDDLLQDANREYGYRRNMRGLKGPALAIIATCFLLNLAGIAILMPQSVQLVGAMVLAVGCAAAAFAWLKWVNMSSVETAAWDYAERLMNVVAAQA